MAAGMYMAKEQVWNLPQNRVLYNDNIKIGSEKATFAMMTPEYSGSPPPTNDLIIDNGDPGTTSTGSWGPSSGPNPYGSGSLTNMSEGGSYSWQGNVSGTKDVNLWWTTYSSRCTNVPVEIYDGNTLLDTVSVNHQTNGGQWNKLGTYTFSGTGRVKLPLTSNACSTSADAVRFSPSDTTTPLGDLNNDGKVDIFDYTIFISDFGKTGSGLVSDLNKDGKVDIFDYTIFSQNFGRTN
jgi:hypothetical protein